MVNDTSDDRDKKKMAGIGDLWNEIGGRAEEAECQSRHTADDSVVANTRQERLIELREFLERLVWRSYIRSKDRREDEGSSQPS